MPTKTDSLQSYLQEMGRYPLLSPEEEISLARQTQSGNLQAKHRMIKCNLRFVIRIAKKHQYRGLPLIDLIQEGNIGLNRAAEKFDPTQGCRFSTYAYWWILQGITRALNMKSRPIRLPEHHWTAVNKIKRYHHQLTQQLGREPSIAELSETMNLKSEVIRQTLQLFQKVISLDNLVGEEQQDTLIDLIQKDDAPVPYMESLQLHDELSQLMAHLGEREQLVISLRYGLEDGQPKTLRAIGKQLGLSQEGIRLIEIKAFKQLRQYVESA